MPDDENIVMVTVATFPEAIEAHIFRNRLEAEGIPSVLADEHIVSNQPWHTIAYGGVKLRVRQHQAVYATLGSLMGNEIHALQLQTYTPAQWAEARKELGL